jgi:hypothetical protein
LQAGNEAECRASKWLISMDGGRTSTQAEKAPTLREGRSASGPGIPSEKHFGEGAVVPTGAIRTAIEALPKPIA